MNEDIKKAVNFLKSVYAAENSLYEFVRQTWHIIEGRPFVDGWHIGAICEHLEAVARGEIKNLIINISPRCAKTTLVGVMFPAWAWISKPESHFLCLTNSMTMVNKSAGDSRAIIESDFYQKRWDHVQIAGYQNSKRHFKNSRGGFRISGTVLGKVTGQGGHFLIIDDPNVTRESDHVRQSIIDIYTSVLMNRVNDPATAARIIMQQRYHQKDLSGFLLSGVMSKDYVHLMIPMEFESARRCKTVVLPSTFGEKWEDPRCTEGELMWPEYMTKESHEATKRSLNSEYLISGQYQQRPAPQEGGILKKNWFKWWKQNAAPHIEHIIQSWDTALGTKKENSYSACTTWGLFYDNDYISNLILLNMWRGKVPYPELRRMATRLSKDYRDDGSKEIKADGKHVPDVILVECQSTGGPLIHDLRDAGIIATPFYPGRYGSKTGSDNARVSLVSHLIENGRVWIPANPPDYTRLRPFADIFIEDVCTFPAVESRDLVDTMTQALIRLKETHMLVNTDDEERGDTNIIPKESIY